MSQPFSLLVRGKRQGTQLRRMNFRCFCTGASATLRINMINYAPYDVMLKQTRRMGKPLCPVGAFPILVRCISVEEADKAACAMEHGISVEIIDKLARFAEFIEICPRGGEDWANGKISHCDKTVSLEVCQECISSVSDKVHKNHCKQLQGGRIVKKLNDVRPGERCKVVKITSKGNLFKRITEMGLTTGTVIEVERVAPLGDPVEMKVKGYHLSLRKDEASKIEVEMI
ncbi:conserved hypothetical protein [Mucispirillum schaedleri ASF457]|nr:conserved hypothetical protein [Mucispirillum schaedleri ASF457]